MIFGFFFSKTNEWEKNQKKHNRKGFRNSRTVAIIRISEQKIQIQFGINTSCPTFPQFRYLFVVNPKSWFLLQSARVTLFSFIDDIRPARIYYLYKPDQTGEYCVCVCVCAVPDHAPLCRSLRLHLSQSLQESQVLELSMWPGG